MEVLKYGASKLIDHVSGEQATAFMEQAIELESKIDAQAAVGKLTAEQR